MAAVHKYPDGGDLGRVVGVVVGRDAGVFQAVASNLKALTVFYRALVLELEKGRAGNADADQHHADVDHIAAVAARVLAHQFAQRLRRTLVQHGLAGPRAAIKLDDNGAQHKAGDGKDGHGVVVAIAKEKEEQPGRQPPYQRSGEVPPQTLDARPPPGNDRADAGQKQQRDSQGGVDLIEEGRPDGDFDAPHPFRKNRKDRTPEGGEGQADKDQIVQQKG